MTESPAPNPPQGLRSLGAVVALLLAIVIGFIAVRVATDWPHIVDGSATADEFAKRYVANPVLAYGHIGLGLVFLLGAPLQLSRRFRTRHYDVHRRLGRLLLGCGLISGALVLAIAVVMPWGGAIEGSAAIAFGTWFLTCLITAFAAIRRDDVARHRRWMIRAFAVGIGVATIRIWVGVFTVFVLLFRGPEPFLPEQTSFGIAFWLGLAVNVAVGEWWLRRTPELSG